jgi:citrate lyase gamma subunit
LQTTDNGQRPANKAAPTQLLIATLASNIVAVQTHEGTMDGMSEREYSNHSGMSRGAIQNAKRSGRLVFYEDGSINAAASDMRRAEMTDPDQQRRSRGSDAGMQISGGGGGDSYLKARTALTVYQAQERQLAIQKKKGALVHRARAEALVFRLARQERDTWVTWPARVSALMAADVAAEVEKQFGTPVMIDAGIMQRVLESHVREQLEALADLRVSLG